MNPEDMNQMDDKLDNVASLASSNSSSNLAVLDGLGWSEEAGEAQRERNPDVDYLDASLMNMKTRRKLDKQ